MSDTIAKLRELLLHRSKAGMLRGLLDQEQQQSAPTWNGMLGGLAGAPSELPYKGVEMTPERIRSGLSGLVDMTPVVGDIKSGIEGVQAAREGDWAGAGLGMLGALPFVPGMAGGIKNTEQLYHGSLGELIGELRKGKGTLGEVFYMTNKPQAATIYPKVHAMKQGIKNPDVRVTEMETSSKNWYDLDEHGGLPVSDIGEDFQKALKNAGYDGITIGSQVLVFDPKTVRKK